MMRVVLVDNRGDSWQVLGRFGELNRVGADPGHTVSIDPADLASIDIQHTRNTRFGRFDAGIGYERREDMATGVDTSETRGFLRWRYDWGGSGGAP